MLKIKIITVGKVKEKSAAEWIGEFEKRLCGYASFEAVVADDAPVPKNPSPAEIEKVLTIERDKILKELSPRSYKISLCIEGKKYDSKGFASLISSLSMTNPEIDFIIGSSHGLHKDIKNNSDLLFSMSDMTFPHNLARLMLTEQIYRAFTIISNTGYHK